MSYPQQCSVSLFTSPWLQKFMVVTALYFGCLHSSALALDINQATAKQLMALQGIGSKMAERIVEERQRAGHFSSWTDVIRRITGIGPKKAEKLQQAGLTVGQVATATQPGSRPDAILTTGKGAQPKVLEVPKRVQPPQRPAIATDSASRRTP